MRIQRRNLDIVGVDISRIAGKSLKESIKNNGGIYCSKIRLWLITFKLSKELKIKHLIKKIVERGPLKNGNSTRVTLPSKR